MARPKKLNAEFFSHDVDMRNDLKVKALRKRFGHKGYSFWNMILEHLGNCDYFEYEWNELNIELLSTDFDLTSEELNELVDYCVKLELLQIYNGFLTCNKFTDRLLSTLINSREGFSMENSKRMGLSNSLPTENSMETQGNTQSRVEYSKGEYSKGEESRLHDPKGECSIEDKSRVEKSIEDAFSELTKTYA
jgi:hypothetical protein